MMKKILVVLLVLAVAAGVFAQQGEWTLGGGAEVGTRLNFDPGKGNLYPDGSSYKATVDGEPFNGYEVLRSELNLAYHQGGLTATLGFKANGTGGSGGDARGNQRPWENAFKSQINGSLDYYGENYAFSAAIPFHKLLRANPATISDEGSIWEINTLWGYYNFLNGLVHLEAAYSSNDKSFWESDMTAAIVNKYGGYSTTPFGPAFRANQNTWGGVADSDYLLTNIELTNLQFGIKIPNLFKNGGHVFNSSEYDATTGNSEKYYNGVINGSVVGVKFGVELFEFAAQFTLQDYGAYFGGKVNVGPLKAGLSFSGVLGEKNTNGENVGLKMKVGGNVTYSSDLFDIGVAAFMGSQKFDIANGGFAAGTSLTQIGVEPQFAINVIPTHLRFTTDIGFYFNNAKVEGTKLEGVDSPWGEESAVVWGVKPQLFWNFLGTGAGGWGATGVGIKYTMLSGPKGGTTTVSQRDGGLSKTNELQVAFKWNFF
jgi:hypothetical protein